MQLTRIGSGTGPGSKFGTEAIVDGQRGALRVSLNPMDCSDANGSAFGFYSSTLRTGSLAATIAAAAPLVSMRWTSAGSVAVILAIRVAVQIVTAVTTVVTSFFDCEAILARAFTASDTTGTATGTTKMRATQQNSVVGDLRVATTAALTAGTRTLDAIPFAFVNCPLVTQPSQAPSGGVASGLQIGVGSLMQDLYKLDRMGGHPPVLQANEGLIIRQSSAGPASGTYQVIATIDWAELPSF